MTGLSLFAGDEPLALDYFSGGVPTGEYFSMTLDELRSISQSESSEKASAISRLQEICFIGLMSYFEAFCKDHFASILNLEPSLFHSLKQAGKSVDLDATRLLVYGESVFNRLGFLVAEKFDFGSAQKINALFNALLKLTPFGKSEAAEYAALLNDRNLLVHHGGTFTLSYLEQRGTEDMDLTTDAFFNSRITGKADVLAAMAFVEGVARKLVNSSQKALSAYVTANKIQYSGERQKALAYMRWTSR